MKKERNLGIDLLKLVLALMIVVNHSIGHGLEQYDAALYENSKIALGFLWGVCNPAVNVFFIISGYFLIKRSVNKFIVLLEPQLILAIIYLLVFGFTIKKAILNILFPWENWWFITTYLILFVLSPYINKIIETLSDKEILKFVISFSFINLLQGYIFKGNLWGNGFSFAHAMNMYLIGIVLYKYREILREKNKNHIFYLIVYVICSVIMALLKIYFNTELGEMIDTYNNPLVVIQAICMFEFFVNLEIKTKRFNIDMFSKTALMVYLITDYPEIRQYIFLPMIAVVRKFNMPVIWIIINAIVIVLIVTLITWLNVIIMVRILKKIDRQYQD